MHEGLMIAASAGAKQQIKMDVLANNLANLNNAGFKSDGLIFREIFPPFDNDTSFETSRNVLLPPNQSNGNVAYVAVADFYIDYAQGVFQQTGNTLDLALDGEGFFELETPQGTRYTRNGNFRLNTDNLLVTQDGNLVMGDDETPIQIDAQGGIIAIASDGTISVGTGLENIALGNIRLVKFDDPSVLVKEGNGLYENVNPDAIAQPTKEMAVRQGFLERSNVNQIEEMTNMITTIRAFEAYQKVIQTIDEADDQAVNAIGRVV
ncbi:hypothetical protein UR09_03415 [Candidatus Nitromaritima sp. SCGC AAA799-A02]|nr:hypothetical protein UZ36_06380 [Candidatus Nitromaritima sp. SCGC AAA799-C22]KMP11418.1 hypothetical protein UR09_03415 [Candidatus Nitromaritima sp. SCGC AAA799-A02]